MTYAKTWFLRGSAFIVALISLTLLAACGGGKTTTTVGPSVSISLNTSAPQVHFGESVTATATVYDPNNQGVIWQISPLSFGTLSNSAGSGGTYTVTYTAPANWVKTTKVTISAMSISNLDVMNSIQISADPVVVSFTLPGPVGAFSVSQGGVAALSASVLNIPSGGAPTVSWAISPASGAGSIDVQTGFILYNAPASVSQPVTATVTATADVSASASNSIQITVFPDGGGSNVTALHVDGGPVPGQTYQNGAFTSVTLCSPGVFFGCQTIDGVLLDTGSVGLRVLQSELPILNLSGIVDAKGNALQSCQSNPDQSYIWGPVARADVYIGGESTANQGGALAETQVQIISSSNALVPDGCSNGGIVNLNTPQLLGANGILGIGPEPTDCTLNGVNLCDSSTQPTPPNLYYSCPKAGCALTDAPVSVAATQQLTNPVVHSLSLEGVDSNGYIIQMPAINGASANVVGKLIFGIGTEANNSLTSQTVLPLDALGHFTTSFAGQTLTVSSIDSGSNALFFPYTFPACTSSTSFFCPPVLTPLSATNSGAGQGQNTVDFNVDNADSLFSTYPGYPAFDNLAGPNGTYNSCSAGTGDCTFDWGFPFYYGRSVYTLIDGQNAPFGAPLAPWIAY